MTAKTRIRLALGGVAFLATITALISMNYLNRTVESVQRLISVDTRIAELGESLSIRFLEVRRDEKNFIITLDTSYVDANRRTLTAMKTSIAEAYDYAPDYSTELDSLLNLMATYGHSTTLLVKSLKDDPRSLNRLQRQLKNYETEISRLQQKGRITREAADQLSEQMTLDVESAASAISNEKAAIFTNLRLAADAITATTRGITAKARASLTQNAGNVVQKGLEAQRNTLTLFFLAIIAAAYFIVVFPHRLFIPLQNIMRWLKALERGDEAIDRPAGPDDEFGRLGSQVEVTLDRIKLFNQLKTQKITDHHRHQQRLLDALSEAVLFVSTDLIITLSNQAAREFWEGSGQLNGRSLKNLTLLWEALEPVLSDIQRQGRQELTVRLNRRNLTKKRVVVLPRKSQDGRVESITIVIS